ncbi:unnamed protein product [Boreogadus saida]
MKDPLTALRDLLDIQEGLEVIGARCLALCVATGQSSGPQTSRLEGEGRPAVEEGSGEAGLTPGPRAWGCFWGTEIQEHAPHCLASLGAVGWAARPPR